jgi:RNA polymerase sigma factor (sigma-70 family)
MIPGKTGRTGRQLERLWAAGTLTGLTDAELLGRFVEAGGRDAMAEAAFREQIHRHAPMVLGVCRQILRRRHDVDDAFQATFLVLVRKAPSIRVGDSLAPWLCSVAYRTAHRARADAARLPSTGVEMLREVAGPASDDAFRIDVRPLLHEELERLPEKFRDPIVLCHLEGRSLEEAARLLHWPVGTVSSRLSRGRRLLRSRLERRGVTAPAAMLAAHWLAGTPTPVSPSRLESTVTAAIRFAASQSVSTVVLSLTQGVLRIMWLRKVARIALAVGLFTAATGGFAVWAHWPSHSSKAAPAAVRDGGSTSQPDQAPAGTQPAGSDVQVADCSEDCFPPDCCPISMAANAVSRMLDRFSSSSNASR